MLCALDMSVHSTHSVWCRMSMERSSYIGHGFECSGTNCITLVCIHGTGLALRLVQNRVGLEMGRSPIEFPSVKRKWKMKCVGRSK